VGFWIVWLEQFLKEMPLPFDTRDLLGKEKENEWVMTKLFIAVIYYGIYFYIISLHCISQKVLSFQILCTRFVFIVFFSNYLVYTYICTY
jgi:hypothetical protein